MVDFLGKPDPNVINEEVYRMLAQTVLMSIKAQIQLTQFAIESNILPVAEAFAQLEERIDEYQRIAAS
jgi:hypothetical protein